jgi:hypothetical protein
MVATNRAPSKIELSRDAPPVEQPKPQPKAKSDTETHYAYQGLNHFRATYRDKKDDHGEFGLVLERRGVFKWMLVRIELPMSPLKR